MQLMQFIVSSDLQLRSIDIQEIINLDENLFVLVLQERLQKLSLFLNVISGELPSVDIMFEVIDAFVQHLLCTDLVIGL
jgi:hypothetical protein